MGIQGEVSSIGGAAKSDGMSGGEVVGISYGWAAGPKPVPWCKECKRTVPVSEVRAMAAGNYYYHMIARPASEIGSGAREQRCGRIEWRTSAPERRASAGEGPE